MSEPVKKPRKTPESYGPTKPEIANMMKEAEEKMSEQLKINPLYDSFEVKKCGPYRFIGKTIYMRAWDDMKWKIYEYLWEKHSGEIFNTLDKMENYASDMPFDASIRHWEQYRSVGGFDKQGVPPYEIHVGHNEEEGYTIGRFMKADTPVPDNMKCIDIPEIHIATLWGPGDIWKEIDQTGMYKSASWIFEGDVRRERGNKSKDGNGLIMAVIPFNEDEKAEWDKEKKAEDDSEKAKPELIKMLDNLIFRCEPTEIDLKTFVNENNSNVHYTNGLLELSQGAERGLITPDKYKAPLKIELRLKTSSRVLFVKYGKGQILYANGDTNNLHVYDIENGKGKSHKTDRDIPVGEFAAIEWILAEKFTAVKINGELWFIGNNFKYINEFKENPGYDFSSPVIVAADSGNTITVEKLRVTEI